MKRFKTGKSKGAIREAGGFTILELLIAAALSVVILSVAVGISTTVLRNWNAATSDLNRDAQLRYAEQKLRTDLEQSVVTRDLDQLWLIAEVEGSGEWSIRWLAHGPGGLSFVEWTTLPVEYNGEPSLLGFSLFRFDEGIDWETTYGANGGLGENKPSESSDDETLFRSFAMANILESKIELGVYKDGDLVSLLGTESPGTLRFPYVGDLLYSKPDYIKLQYTVMSDDKLQEYEALEAQLGSSEFESWLARNTNMVTWTFDVMSAQQ